MSDDKFYSTFRDSVIGKEILAENDLHKSHRVKFLTHQQNIIPAYRALTWGI